MQSRFKLARLVTLSFIFSVAILGSCQKESSGSGSGSDTTQEELASSTSAQAEAEADIVFNTVFDVAMGANDNVGMGGIGILGRVTLCYSVTVTRLSTANDFPVRITVDFGTVGCTGNDGHTRKGKVITEYTNRLINPGAVATTTFDGYYVDSIKVEGTHTITNNGSNTAPVSRQFVTDITGGKLTKPNDNYTEWNSHKVITQTEGLITPNLPLDDIFSITGSAQGRLKKDALLVAWESTITEPLIKKFSCRWLVKGKVRSLRANTSANSPFAAVIDFGNGDCDDQAVLTVNGTAHNISLH